MAGLAIKLPAAFGGESIWMMQNLRPTRFRRPEDFNNVEPRRVFEQAVRFEKRGRRASHSLPAVLIDRQRRPRAGLAAAGFNFDEDDRLPIDGDDVEFAVTQPASCGDNAIPALPAQKA